ncbi:flagellar filament capping protein FliD [Rummeliibacillus suwonensis]|uniref:flagellar filament capping protein FliD n=1 Tax=Rummeliibacillus suwonensis TaxID=1306154 RepID=UPI001AAE393E|nr:flagellar filament capping protein FliD [Rummeliibacillus suwonensis]MBO2534276.1 flagellar filament capping protein FliD [Rummeliibacillus suwonensis]
MTSVNSTSSSTQLAYSYLQYKNKIGGLVSGMDIDSIMEKLMKAESAQMEKLQQQKQKYEWTRDAYREVNTSLSAFRDGLWDNYGTSDKWNTKTATTSLNDSVTVKAGTAASGNLTISQVTVAQVASQNYDSASVTNKRITADTNLSDIGQLGVSSLKIFGTDATTAQGVIDQLKANGYSAGISNGQFTISAGKDAVQFDDDTRTSLEKLGFTFNVATQTSGKLTFDKDGETQTAAIDTKLSDIGLTSGTLQINGGETIDLNSIVSEDPDATVSDLLMEVQKQGYKAYISDGRISIESEDGKASLSVESTISSTTFQSPLANSTGTSFVTTSADSTLQNSSTIQEVLGGAAQDGMFTLRAVQADGSTKDTTITYKGTDTISSLMSKINSSGAGVTAIFNNGQLNISANNTGVRTGSDDLAEVSILSTVKDESGNDVENTSGALELFSKLTNQTMTADGNTEKELTLANGGSNASITVNGVQYEQNSNDFNIAGYTITATKNLDATQDPVKVTSSNDVDKAVEKVKAFVETYNGLIKDLNTRVTEKKNLDYAPLTDAQKAEMTEDQISKWEVKAKAGLLKSDDNIEAALYSMRSTLSQYGSESGDTLYKIGITTSKEWSDNGKLEIDEEKLRKAVEADPDILKRIFNGNSATGENGVIADLRDSAKTAITNIEQTAGKASSTSDSSYSLGRTISDLDTKIDNWKDRLKDIEERYWNQFSAMEQAIQKANSQSSIFSSGS